MTMCEKSSHACTICGEESLVPARWFLVTENRWEDKLQILPWDDRLADRAGVHRACSSTHVQELVVHWMATGSLDYPFARAESWSSPARRWSDLWAPRPDVDMRGMRPIGELCVHRESMRRVLTENPGSLKAILEALNGALQPPADPEGGREAVA